MNIGDKVRMIHAKEQGVITKFLKNDLVEVEIEDGFKIPVKKSEITIISAVEEKYFKPETPSSNRASANFQPAATSNILANTGIYMAFLAINDREYAQHLVNNTDWEVPYVLYVGTEPHLKGIKSGVLQPKSGAKVQDLQVKDFEEWGVFTFQSLSFRLAFMTERPIINKKLRFRANTFFKSKFPVPLMGKDGLLFQLDEEIDRIKIDPAQLSEKMMGAAPLEKEKLQIPKPSNIVDLHIERLTPNYIGLSNQEMLTIQLKTFETNLENAIANGMSEMIFIHGIGNGVLKNEIHRIVSKNKNIRFYEDAQKERFGYGATKIKFK